MSSTSEQSSKKSAPRVKRGYGGLTADARDALRREQLTAAGIDQFGTTGFSATTVESLCGAARVSTRDFYAYFATKEDLLLAVYDRIIDETLGAVTAAVAEVTGDAAASINAGLDAFVNAMVRDERWARINFIEIVGVSARAEIRRREAIHAFAELIRIFTDPMAERGRTIPLTPIQSIAVVGAVHESLTDWVMLTRRPPLESVVSELTALFIAAIRR